MADRAQLESIARSQSLPASLFDVEIETCTRCGGQLKIIASIEEPQLIAKILSRLDSVAAEHSQSELPLVARGPPAQSSLL